MRRRPEGGAHRRARVAGPACGRTDPRTPARPRPRRSPTPHPGTRRAPRSARHAARYNASSRSRARCRPAATWPSRRQAGSRARSPPARCSPRALAASTPLCGDALRPGRLGWKRQVSGRCRAASGRGKKARRGSAGRAQSRHRVWEIRRARALYPGGDGDMTRGGVAPPPFAEALPDGPPPPICAAWSQNARRGYHGAGRHPRCL